MYTVALTSVGLDLLSEKIMRGFVSQIASKKLLQQSK